MADTKLESLLFTFWTFANQMPRNVPVKISNLCMFISNSNDLIY